MGRFLYKSWVYIDSFKVTIDDECFSKVNVTVDNVITEDALWEKQL